MATTLAPWAIVPVIAVWVFVGRFDAVVDVMKGDQYFFESFARYLTFVVQWTSIGIGVAYAATVLYGIPAYLTLAMFKYERPLGFLLAGTLGGGLLALLWNVGLIFGAVLVACGASVATVFWAIIRK